MEGTVPLHNMGFEGRKYSSISSLSHRKSKNFTQTEVVLWGVKDFLSVSIFMLSSVLLPLAAEQKSEKPFKKEGKSKTGSILRVTTSWEC